MQKLPCKPSVHPKDTCEISSHLWRKNRGRECTYSPPQPRRLAPKNRDALTLFRGNFARRKETVPPPMSPMVREYIWRPRRANEADIQGNVYFVLLFYLPGHKLG